MKTRLPEKEVQERLSRAFDGREVLDPNTPQNHSAYRLVHVGNHRSADRIAELINERLSDQGEVVAAVFPVHFAQGTVNRTAATKNWLAMDMRGGLEQPVLDAIEAVAQSHEMQVRLRRAKPLRQR